MEKKKKSRDKFKHDYGMNNIYQFYKKTYNDVVDYTTFSKVIDLFNLKIIEEIYNGAYITLPYSLGDLFINKYKPKYKFDQDGQIITKGKYKLIDYKATKELWSEHPELIHKQIVCYDNFHTDGYKFRINWKRYHTLRAHKLYNFIPARAFQRGLAAYLRKNPNQDYYGK